MEKHRILIGLLVETSTAYGRDLIKGVADFAKGPSASAGFAVSLVPWPGRIAPSEASRFQGLIARIQHRSMLEDIETLKLPTVNVCNGEVEAGCPVVEADGEVIARLAFEHLAGRGLRQLAYVGPADLRWSAERGNAFAALANRHGQQISFHTTGLFGGPLGVAQAESHLRASDAHLEDMRLLLEWLGRLPKPAGILACNDLAGARVLEACGTLGLEVPAEVAVLGVDDDDVLGKLAVCPLSSVRPDAFRAGREAAAVLDRMLAGARDLPPITRIPPAGVVTRASTDRFIEADPVVAAAVDFIRRRACEGIEVRDVLKVAGLSRRQLDQRFSAAVGHTPSQEIVRVRLDAVKSLLETTDWTVATIAEKTGFNHAESLSRAFRRLCGVSPGAYRAGAYRANVRQRTLGT